MALSYQSQYLYKIVFMKYFISFLLCIITLTATAQSYKDSIAAFREKYKQEFLEDARSPLKKEDLQWLRFFDADKRYCVLAQLVSETDTTSFNIPTHSGKMKRYKRYGYVYFRLKGQGKNCKLSIYQSCDLVKQEAYKNHLFLPFTDATNYKSTYAGGRYIDLSTNDIEDDRILIDFNKAYNPYCAYADGYNCPIPPDENKMKCSVKAGEKLFGKKK